MGSPIETGCLRHGGGRSGWLRAARRGPPRDRSGRLLRARCSSTSAALLMPRSPLELFDDGLDDADLLLRSRCIFGRPPKETVRGYRPRAWRPALAASADPCGAGGVGRLPGAARAARREHMDGDVRGGVKACSWVTGLGCRARFSWLSSRTCSERWDGKADTRAAARARQAPAGAAHRARRTGRGRSRSFDRSGSSTPRGRPPASVAARAFDPAVAACRVDDPVRPQFLEGRPGRARPVGPGARRRARVRP